MFLRAMRETASFTGLVLKGWGVLHWFSIVLPYGWDTKGYNRFKNNYQTLSCIDRNILTFKLDLYLTLEVNGSSVRRTHGVGFDL